MRALSHRSPWVLAAMLGIGPVPVAAQSVREVHLGTPVARAVVQFTNVISVRELPDGRLLVSDPGEQALRLVDWERERVDLIGGIGDGPGEYRTPGLLYPLGSDSTLFTDGYSGRWSVWVRDGFATTQRHSPYPQLVEESILGTDHLGHVLIQQGYRFSGAFGHPTAADSLVLLLARRDWEVVDTVARVAGAGAAAHRRPPSGGRPGVIAFNPLAAQDQALLYPDGWIAVARQSPYRVDWRAPDGRWRTGRPLPFVPIKLDRAAKCAVWRESGLSPLMDCDPDFLPEWPEVLPPFHLRPSGERTPVLLASPDGALLIRRTRFLGPSETTYDIVGRHGELVGVLLLPADERLVGFGQASAYVLRRDEWDLQTLVRYPWP